MGLISLNVGHQTWARPIPSPAVATPLDQKPDLLVLVEYVEGDGHPELRDALADAGLQHVVTSVQVQCQGRSWCWPEESASPPSPPARPRAYRPAHSEAGPPVPDNAATSPPIGSPGTFVTTLSSPQSGSRSTGV